jgi:pSer/pThr/pTyr-binding forkhead associated (FHA) protein
MVTCNNCHSKQLDGSIFCVECGASISYITGGGSTRTLGEEVGAPQISSPPTGRGQSDVMPAGPAVTLLMLASGRRLTSALADELLLGREDSARGIVPDIDLGSEGGHDAGVSRRHAILAYRDGIWTAEDLGSANGTYLNGRRLVAQTPAQLSNGDELVCGTLRMRVEIR